MQVLDRYLPSRYVCVLNIYIKWNIRRSMTLISARLISSLDTFPYAQANQDFAPHAPVTEMCPFLNRLIGHSLQASPTRMSRLQAALTRLRSDPQALTVTIQHPLPPTTPAVPTIITPATITTFPKPPGGEKRLPNEEEAARLA